MMNKTQLVFISISLAFLSATVFKVKNPLETNPAFLRERNEASKEEEQGIKGAMAYYKEIAANQITGRIDQADVSAARVKMQSMFNKSFTKTRAFANMEWSETGPNNVGGRTRIVISDKNDPNKLYMGGVAGGFWISNDNGNNWDKKTGNDSTVAISICSITQAANGDIYYGTGEGQNWTAGVTTFTEQPFQLGEGIFKSTDGGLTFTQLSATKPLLGSNTPSDPWSYVDKLVADPVNSDKIIAATYGGLKITTNGGTTWSKPSNLTVGTHFLDVEISSDGNKIVASTGNTLYISNNGGTTFSGNLMGANGLPNGASSQRIDVAIAPSDSNYVYATIVSAESANLGGLKGVYMSTNGGQTWTAIGLGGSFAFNPLGNQGRYNVAFGVHPTNKEMVFLGGQLNFFRYTPSTGWEAIADAGQSASSGKYIHADMHCVSFNSSNPENMYVTCDGGIFRSFNCSATNPFFAEKNKNYNVTQCYGLAANYLGKVIFGTQDNGSGLLGESANSALESRDITGGDGSRCAMSDLEPNVIITSRTDGDALWRATDGGQTSASFKSFYDKNIDAGPSGSSNGVADENELGGTNPLWVQPMLLKEKVIAGVNKSVYLYGTYSSVWMTQGVLKGNPVWFRLFSQAGLGFSALTMSDDGKTVYAGTRSGKVYRISVPSLWDSTYKYIDTISNSADPTIPYTYPLYPSCVTTTIATYAGRYITDLSCSSSGNTLIVTMGNYANTDYVYKSTNAIDSLVPTFTNITTNLPKMPIYSSLCVGGNGNMIMLGTELGIWGSDNGGTSWTELNLMNSDQSKWHPRVLCYELVEKNIYANVTPGMGYNGPVIYSGTHGRGTFRSTSLATYGPTPTSVSNYTNHLTESISIYPNPANTSTSIEYDSKEAGDISIKIYSLTGAVVKQFQFEGKTGLNNIPVDVSNLAPGGYIVYLNAKGKKAASKFVKQ